MTQPLPKKPINTKTSTEHPFSDKAVCMALVREEIITLEQARDVFERRDRIIEKARRDAATYGEGVVFHEESCPPVTARRRR